MKLTVTIISECSSGNLGDQAISRSLAAILLPRFEVRLVPFCQLDRSSTNSAVPRETESRSALRRASRIVPPKLKARIRWYLLGERKRFEQYYRRSIEDSALVVIGGGQLIRNNIALFCDRLALLGKLGSDLKVPYALVGVGVDRNMGKVTWRLAGVLVRRCSFAILRDEMSRQRMRQNIKCAPECSVLPDLAFALKNPAAANTNRRISLGINIMNFDVMLGEVNPSLKGDAMAIIARYCAIVKCADRAGSSITLFTSGSPDDFREAQRVKSVVLAQTGIEVPVFHPESLDALLEFLVDVRDVLATRMHAGILAYISGCNPVCLNWNDKVHGVWSAIGQEVRVFEIEDFVADEVGVTFLEKLQHICPPSPKALVELSGNIRMGVTDEIAVPVRASLMKIGIEDQ